MMKADHAKHVDAWLEQAAKDASVPALLDLFESAWSALWLRAESAVGEIVLESIAALIQAKGVERYPFLSPLGLESSAVSCEPLLESAPPLGKRELQEGLGFLLVELITMIGDLTDQILTPGLHDELSRISLQSKMRNPDKDVKRPPESRMEMEETTMTAEAPMNSELISTGIRNLDEMLAGGLIKGSLTAIAGPPGSGKTILAQQIAFQNATPENPVLFFSTLSEPGAKNLFYLKRFRYFDPKKIHESIHFIDLGILLRTKGLQKTLDILVQRVKKLNPAFVVIDSFKVFEDMAASTEDLRKFSYELVINLIARKCTTLFLGEYSGKDFERNPLFSIIDGLIALTQRELSGEQQRFIQVIKMRGLGHSREEHTFKIGSDGIEIFAPRLTIKRSAPAEPKARDTPHCKIGIAKLDDLLGAGIPRGSSLLIAGVAGTGKTVLGLEFVYRGALAGEKGIVFSFEETDARLRAAARGLGWDLDAQIAKGMVKIVFIPQPEILVEHHLLMMREEIHAMKAVRVTVDSLSVFLHKIKDGQIVRDKVFQLASVVQNAEAVAFFATDVPYGSSQISRFGVEETVVDGVIILTSTEEGMERQRYIEIYKLRNTAHLKGRHTMTIDTGGIQIFPRYRAPAKDLAVAPPPAKIAQRLSTGNAALDKLIGNGLMVRSVTLISGSSGIGKSILALQFLLEGAAKGEPGLYVTLEEGPEELLVNAKALGLPLQKAVDDGLVDIVYLPPTHIRSTQLLALLTDKITQKKTQRMVLDSTTHIVASGMERDDVRELLYDLVARVKNLGVTSVFTLESESMYSRESNADDRGFTPLADNIIVLRYVPADSKVLSALMVVKTRGSTHDSGHYSFTIGQGGLQLGASMKMLGGGADQTVQAVGTGRKH